MSAMASQITGVYIVCSTLFFRRRSKKTSKLSVTGFFRGIQRWSMDSPHKKPVTRKMFPVDDVAMCIWNSLRCSTPKMRRIANAIMVFADVLAPNWDTAFTATFSIKQLLDLQGSSAGFSVKRYFCWKPGSREGSIWNSNQAYITICIDSVSS